MDLDAVERVEQGLPPLDAVLGLGGGSSLDMAKYVNEVESVDPAGRTAVVQAGIVLDELNRAVKPHGLVFGPKPATHNCQA